MCVCVCVFMQGSLKYRLPWFMYAYVYTNKNS